MNRSGDSAGPPSRAIRAALVDRLRAQLPEIEAAVFKRVRSLRGPHRDEDPEYLAGLRAAVLEAVDYGLNGIERGDEDASLPIPPAAAAQARRAARSSVNLDTVMRRYAAGDRVLGEFILNQEDHFSGDVLRQVLREQGSRVDRLMAAVATEYMRELERIRRSPAMRVAERVEALLADDGFASFDGLDYEPDGWHLGMVVKGAKAEETVRAMASRFDRRALSIRRGDATVWAWLGGRRPLVLLESDPFLGSVPDDVSIAVGEPRRGRDGWRLTHQEAQAALQVMLQRPEKFTRGSDKVLLAAVLRDPPLAESLTETYLRPLDNLGDAGGKLFRTLHAYIATGFNAESASASLDVDRSTVQRHLRKIEDQLGRQLHTCHAELKVALELRELAGRGGEANI
jgi:hypothetical protein